MDVALLRFLAQSFGASLTATARPATTFFVVQAVAAVLVHYGTVGLPSELAWTVSWPAVVVAAVIALVENMAAHDADMAEMAHDMGFDRAAGAIGTLAAVVLFAAMGLPSMEAVALGEPAAVSGLTTASSWASAAEQSSWTRIGVVGFAVVANLGLGWLRARFMAFVVDMNLAGVWARIETGGVLGVLILVVMLPVVAALVVLSLAAVLAVLGLGAQTMGRWWDARQRVACGACGASIRPEASACPKCGAVHTPRVLLVQPATA